MELVRTDLREGLDGYQRLVGLVRYQDGTEEEYWYETPSDYRLAESGHMWVATLLPLAAILGEPIRLNLPIDPLFYIKIRALLRLWNSWFPYLHKIPIEADQQQVDLGAGREGATFFSAGVDAFFTALRHEDAKSWIFWLGYNTPIEYRDSFKVMVARKQEAANEMGRRLFHGATNARRTRSGKISYDRYVFGASLAAIALMFEKYFSKVYIPSSRDYGCLRICGSHPLSDELFTSSQTRIVHDGTEYRRIEKVQYIANYEIAMRLLHVCNQGRAGKGSDETNCCRCAKCLRTMIDLEIMGKLKEARLFNAESLTPEQISRIYLNRVEMAFFEQMREMAVARGRHDIVRSIDGVIASSDRVRPWVEFAERISTYRFLWRYGPALRKRFLNGMIDH